MMNQHSRKKTVAKTKIQWTARYRKDSQIFFGYTVNPWIGCTRKSIACDNCYAAEQDTFRKWTPEGWGRGMPRHKSKTALKELLRIDRYARKHDVRLAVFIASLADVFDQEVPDEWRMELFNHIAQTENLDILLLTKRTGEMVSFFNKYPEALPVLDKCLLGATVVTNTEFNIHVPNLLSMKCRGRFLSIEPMLKPLESFLEFSSLKEARKISQVIVGGESGTDARPINPAWVEDIEGACSYAGIPYFFKQWGEWAPLEAVDEQARAMAKLGNVPKYIFKDGQEVYRFGKNRTAHYEARYRRQLPRLTLF
jgi:protein gp37